ncbi:MAG TPA: tannase/feruloyl esterase family alpha/beta hydrolase [Steroidobacter sp.]|uniref:tannase/feruloyl esterase family alpha/beta hydrolase n=1 Tax=Steroidobacter sp. TaxID=1978227 RepID=UPI002ED91C62
MQLKGHAIFTTLVLLSPAAFAVTDCVSLTALKIPGYDITIKQAAVVPASPPPASTIGSPEGTLPSYCRVDGAIDERTGSDGKPYAIGFAVALPENWNGRFLFQGGGGLNGSVRLPIGSTAAGTKPALARGYAVVSTDSGHKGEGFDTSFFKEQEAALNFLYQAIGKVAPVGKAIVAAYYGKPADHSYFVGCSTGGREAMIMSQRYPRYFDGSVAGAPAMRTSFSNLADKYVTVALNAVAPRDDSGKPITAKALSESDKKLVVDSLLKACDARDGVADGMVFDVNGCGFDPKSLVCKGAKTDSCLTSAQADAIATGFAGPRDSRGDEVYPGWFYDTGIAATVGIPGLLNPGPSPVGPPTVATTMDVDKDAQIAASPIAVLGDSAHWTRLDSFFQHGGKLIFFHGISDPWFSAKDTIRYYTKMTADNGAADVVMQSSRLFLVPGMGHCGGGAATLDRFDMLTSIESWVEKGTAPDFVEATGRAFPGRSRPLCPYPKHAHYRGSGDTEKAASFECRE